MNQEDDHDTLRDEYDFSGGVRGKHYKAYRQGTNLVLLEPDVAKILALPEFPWLATRCREVRYDRRVGIHASRV
jgi:hypothetical protein